MSVWLLILGGFGAAVVAIRENNVPAALGSTAIMTCGWIALYDDDDEE